MSKSRRLKDAVKAYSVSGSEDEKRAIVALKDEWDILKTPVIVYRGQSNEWGEKNPADMILFSTTTDKDVATREFSDTSGCVWKITLNPGVRVLDVNAILGDLHSKAFEKELIVLGGEQMAFTVSRDKQCTVAATYGGPRPETRTVTLETLRRRARETEEDLFDETSNTEYLKQYLNPGEVLGGKRRKTRRKRRSTRYNASGRV